MTKEIAVALVGAGATIVGAAIPVAWNTLANRRSQHDPDPALKDALLGTWEGEGNDYFVENSEKGLRNFAVVMSFTTAGRTVKAGAILQETGLQEKDEVCLFGMFYNDTYLQLSYYSKNSARKQLGVVVLGLGPD